MREYRRPLPGEFEQILRLQAENLQPRLTPAERKGGFLSTAFTREQLEAMDRSVGIAVCVEQGRLRGYFCASTAECNRATPLQAAMLDHLGGIVYRGKPVSAYRFFVASPICIDRGYRGAGIYLNLCRKILEIAGDGFELAVAFVSNRNTRHLSVIKKIGMEIVGGFEAGGDTFSLGVMPLPAAFLKQWPLRS